MTFEVTVTLQLQADTLGGAVVDVEGRLKDGPQPLRLSAMSGKVVSTPKEKEGSPV